MFKLPAMDLTKSVQQGVCWVCPTTTSIEGHHVIPRCSGGTDGPIIDLCGVCHTLIHTLAESLNFNQEYRKLLSITELEHLTGNGKIKVIDLSYVIQNSALLTKDSSNKTVGMSFKLNSIENEQLEAIAKSFGLGKEHSLKRLIPLYYKTITK